MNKIVVKIANQEYSITGEEEKDYILSLACHVDEQIRLAQSHSPKLNNLTPVILASINIADQLFKERAKNVATNDYSFVRDVNEMRDGISNDALIEEQSRTIDKLYDRIQKQDKVIQEKDELINSIRQSLEQLKLENESLNVLVSEFQNDMQELQLECVKAKRNREE